MDEIRRRYYEQEFRIAFLTAKRDAFQALFEKVMEKAHPADFMPCRPWGSTGDRKNDGYLASERTLFQVYAPNEMKAADAIKKIHEDFHGALPFWSKHFDKWVFVHNAERGLSPQVNKELLDLGQTHPELVITHWSFEELRQRLQRIPLDGLQALFGSVPLAAATLTAQRPTSLPVPDGDLKGRSNEEERVANALRSGRHVVIHGMPGLGKTQLALSVANALQLEFHGGQIFVPLQIQATTVQPPSDVLIAALHALKGTTAELPTDEISLRAAYDNALAGRKWLVVVDNAQTADVAKVLKPHAPSGLLVTARAKLVLDGAECVRPELLSADDAKDFLQTICPRLANDIAHRIAALCGCLPLALRNAGSLLHLYEDKDPAQFAGELSDERTRLRQLNPDNDLVDVEASFNLSYMRLDPETAQVFASLAVFPATFSQDAEIAVCIDTAGRKLSHLVRQGLVFFSEKTERYYLHDLLRLFAQSRLGKSDRDLRIRHAEHFAGILSGADELCAVDGKEFRTGVESFEAERANIIGAWTWVVKEFNADKSVAALCSRFAKVGGRIAGRQLPPEQRITFFEAAARAASVLEQPELRAEHLYDQAHAINDKGELPEIGHSMQLLQEALVSARDLGLRVLILAQMARNHLRVEPQSSRTKRAALDCQKEAWKIAQETDDTELKVRATTRLATACLANYQQKRAWSLYNSALAMVEPSRQRLQAFVLNGYGNFFRVPAYRKRLIPLLEEARELAAKFESKRDGKDSNFKLGMCLLDNDPAGARECFETSLEMNRALGDQRGIAGSYRDIGRAHLRLNQQSEAIAALNQAKRVCEGIHWERGLRDVKELLEKACHAPG